MCYRLGHLKLTCSRCYEKTDVLFSNVNTTKSGCAVTVICFKAACSKGSVYTSWCRLPEYIVLYKMCGSFVIITNISTKCSVLLNCEIYFQVPSPILKSHDRATSRPAYRSLWGSQAEMSRSHGCLVNLLNWFKFYLWSDALDAYSCPRWPWTKIKHQISAHVNAVIPVLWAIVKTHYILPIR